MSSKWLAALLSFVLLWSGFALPTQGLGVPERAASQMVAEASQTLPDGGSLVDHHIDEQPAQPHGEAASDAVAFIADGFAAPWSPLSLARPARPEAAGRVQPYLEGPQRPPRAAA